MFKYYQGLIGIVGLLSLNIMTVHAASFDCQKARLVTEKAICQQPALRESDRKMSKAYFHLQTLAPQPMQNVLLEEQRHWLGKRDRCQRSIECLMTSYQTRQQQLDEYIHRIEHIRQN